MPSPGFVKADLDALAAIPAADRRPDLPIAVGTEDAWYIYKENANDTESRPNIVEPDDATGRWYRMQATNADPGGGGPGGAANIPVYATAPTTAPSGNGDARAQDTITTATINLFNFELQAISAIDYKIQRRAIWIAEGSTIGSWKQFGAVPTTLEYTNIVGYSNAWQNLQFSQGIPEMVLRFDLGCHPSFIGEKLIEFYRTPSGLSQQSRYYTAGPIGLHHWSFYNGGALPAVNPELYWYLDGQQINTDPTWANS
jgi:hypothetical protein